MKPSNVRNKIKDGGPPISLHQLLSLRSVKGIGENFLGTDEKIILSVGADGLFRAGIGKLAPGQRPAGDLLKLASAKKVVVAAENVAKRSDQQDLCKVIAEQIIPVNIRTGLPPSEPKPSESIAAETLRYATTKKIIEENLDNLEKCDRSSDLSKQTYAYLSRCAELSLTAYRSVVSIGYCDAESAVALDEAAKHIGVPKSILNLLRTGNRIPKDPHYAVSKILFPGQKFDKWLELSYQEWSVGNIYKLIDSYFRSPVNDWAHYLSRRKAFMTFIADDFTSLDRKSAYNKAVNQSLPVMPGMKMARELFISKNATTAKVYQRPSNQGALRDLWSDIASLYGNGTALGTSSSQVLKAKFGFELTRVSNKSMPEQLHDAIVKKIAEEPDWTPPIEKILNPEGLNQFDIRVPKPEAASEADFENQKVRMLQADGVAIGEKYLELVNSKFESSMIEEYRSIVIPALKRADEARLSPYGREFWEKLQELTRISKHHLGRKVVNHFLSLGMGGEPIPGLEDDAEEPAYVAKFDELTLKKQESLKRIEGFSAARSGEIFVPSIEELGEILIRKKDRIDLLEKVGYFRTFPDPNGTSKGFKYRNAQALYGPQASALINGLLEGKLPKLNYIKGGIIDYLHSFNTSEGMESGVKALNLALQNHATELKLRGFTYGADETHLSALEIQQQFSAAESEAGSPMGEPVPEEATGMLSFANYF